MTDWQRVEKLHARGATWDKVARDRKVGFHAPGDADPAGALRALYYRRQAKIDRKPKQLPPVDERRHRAPGSRQIVVLVTILVAFALVVVYVVQYGPNLGAKPTGWVGRDAPDFSLAIANGGGTFTLSAEWGQYNVLLFFNEGLGCSPCLQQMISLDGDAGAFQQFHVVVVQITGDSLSDMSTWSQQSGVSHTIVLADPTLAVSNAYDTTGAAVSMMPGAAPGHTFLLVNETGVVVWRADFGPTDMSVPDSQILQAVQNALSG
ncbi:MAG TPA: redoxin domain-containing protein [Thermoplasmata archaeon]|nr:redoxin domain-containing protein [Thermoplasmata archaeon]